MPTLRMLFFVIVFSVCVNLTLSSQIVDAAAITSHSVIPDFRLQIPIPNLTITSDDLFSGRAIGKYIGAVYKWLTGFVSVLAVLMLVYGGIRWMVGKPDDAKKIIQNSLVGLALTLGSFLLLSTINPDLVNLKSFQISVRKADFDFQGPVENAPLSKSCTDICQDAARAKGPNYNGDGVENRACTAGQEETLNGQLGSSKKCVTDAGRKCLCTILHQGVGAQLCNTNGCGDDGYCDRVSNVCQPKKGDGEECDDFDRIVMCKNGFSCRQQVAPDTKKRCRVDAQTIANGTCCYVTIENRPNNDTFTVATSTPTTFRGCENKHNLRTGTYGDAADALFCERGGPTICGTPTLVNGSGGATMWNFQLGNPSLRTNSCVLFHPNETIDLTTQQRIQ